MVDEEEIYLCQMTLGEEIMFKKVFRDLGGNIELFNIVNNVKSASIITKIRRHNFNNVKAFVDIISIMLKLF